MDLNLFFDLFAKDIQWIREKTIYLAVHGSKAYGTNMPESDTDYKGMAICPKEYYLGFSKHFEQAELKAPNPDCTIFDIKKFFNLASLANPNCLEMLFVEPEDRMLVSPLGEELLENRNLFLSKKTRWTLQGYSFAQLKRIKLHRGYLLNPPKEYPTRASLGLPEQTLIPKDQLAAVEAEIKKEMDKFQFDFLDGLTEPQKIEIRETMASMLAELKITSEDQWLSSARKIGLSDNFILLMQRERAYANAKREWDNYQEWKKNRNPKRAADEAKFGYDGKHAGHLVRLTKMAKELLLTGKMNVRRPDREELIYIRNGGWSYEQLIEFAEREEKEIDILYNTTNILPKAPDINKLNAFCIRLIEKSLSENSAK
jgi:hypothetical protein